MKRNPEDEPEDTPEIWWGPTAHDIDPEDLAYGFSVE